VQYTIELFTGESTEEWIEFWDKRQEIQQATVGQVMRKRMKTNVVPDTFEDIVNEESRWFSQTDPFHAMHQGFSLFYAFETMSKIGVHRVPVLDNTEDVVGILTQSMAISIIRQQKDRLGEMANCKVSEMMNILAPDVVTVKEEDKTITAFRRMVEHNVSGLAIVDGEGVLKGTISVRDLRGVGMSGERFSRLFMPVKAFKELVLKEFPKVAPETHYQPADVPRQPLCVTEDETLWDVIDKMHDGNIHRIFQISKESMDAGKPKPVRVISQRNVVSFILNKLGVCSPVVL